MSDLISRSELYDQLANKLTWLMAYGDDVYLDVGSDIKDVIDNIDTYSLEDIESKLSVICVRNKVSFDNENNEEKGKATTTFTLETEEDETMPAWVKRAMSVAKTLK